ncbi:MAG: hypothetical protein AAFQ55_17115 [Pseudomonadota bacterium]
MAISQTLEPYVEGGASVLALSGNAFEEAASVCQWQDFTPRATLSFLFARRLKLLLQSIRSFPQHDLLYLTETASPRWALYFCYLPQGVPEPNHVFTISKLKAEGFAVLVVCAAPDRSDAVKFDALGVDGLIWKELRGYDFSGYTAGLSALAAQCGDIDLLVLNDSILGPFHAVRPLFESSPWDFTGLVGSYAVENHVVSFCFYFQGFNARVLEALGTVFLRRFSFDAQGPVSLLQETRLSRRAQRICSVGHIISPAPDDPLFYPIIGNPKGLVDAGFPFMKKSIFGRLSGEFDQTFYRSSIEELEHPPIWSLSS